VERVYITGLGAVSPLGLTAPATWRAALDGKSGVRALTRFDASAFQTRFGGEITDFDPLVALERKDARHLDRFAQFVAVAAAEAVADAGLDWEHVDHDRIGVATATGIGGIETLLRENEVLRERGPGRVNPHLIPMMMANAASGYLAVRYGLRGPNFTTVTACTSSAHAVGEAFLKVRSGEADVMLAGGGEACLVPFGYAGFEAMRALSRRNDDPEGACRPFDLGRDGMVMGEGGAMVVLESESHLRRRGGRAYVELAGYGLSADAHHMVEPDPSGAGAALSMRRCLSDAGAPATDVGYVNAHATATVKGDIAESMAIRETFGGHADDLWVSSTKSMHGHLLGGAGAVELVLTALAVRDGAVPPTINLVDADPACDLDYVPLEARERKLQAAMSNSFAFGGHNASLLVRRADGP
jgi:3-oxoacyl-[acyl-carrier-protein] synthase II